MEMGNKLGAWEKILQLPDSAPNQYGIGYPRSISKHDRLCSVLQIKSHDLSHLFRGHIAFYRAAINRACTSNHLDPELVASSDDLCMFLHGLLMSGAKIEHVMLLAA